MPAGPQTAKPLALLLGKHLSYVLLPFLCAHADALYIKQQGGRAFMVESELEAHKTRDKGAVTPIVLVLLHPTC